MVSIDLVGMARLVGGMEDVATYVPGIRTEFNKALDRFDLATWPTAPLKDVAQWASDELPGLRRRLAMARQIEASDASWAAGVVQIDESKISTTDPAVARRQGAQTALALLDGHGVPDDDLLDLLDQMQGDPYFAAGFAQAVTPEQLAQIVTRLSGTRLPTDQSPTYDENLAANKWYERALKSVSATVATATYGTGDLALPSGYADSWVQAITAELPTDLYGDGSGTGRPDQAAALGLLLGSGGAFEGSFLTQVAEGVYDYERAYSAEHGSKVWYPRSTGSSSAGAGIYDPAGAIYVDPLVGIMGALSKNPVAAQGFFSAGGTTTIEVDGEQVSVGQRLQYLLVERTWATNRPDDGTALGLALEAATTTFRDRTDRGATSARIAGESFALIGEQTGDGASSWRGDQGWQMWHGMRQPVARMLASYGTDVFRVAAGIGSDDLSEGVSGAGSGVVFPDDAPYGVRMSAHDLEAIVGTLGEDPDDFTPLLAGVFQAGNLAVSIGLERAKAQQTGTSAPVLLANGTPLDFLDSSITESAGAVAWILQHGLHGATASEAAQATRSQLVADALSLAGEMPFIPDIGNEWVDLAVGHAKDYAIDAVTATQGGTADQYDGYDQRARATLETTTLDLLLRAGYLDQSVADESAAIGGVVVTAPPEEAIVRDENGAVIGFDFTSTAFTTWYANAAIRRFTKNEVIATYASAWSSVG